jgi:hypothetical protein
MPEALAIYPIICCKGGVWLIKECIDIFNKESERYEKDRLVLDNYLPKDGTYILIEICEVL